MHPSVHYETDPEEILETPWEQRIAFDIEEHVGKMIGGQCGKPNGFAIRAYLGQNLVSRRCIRSLQPISARLTLEASLGDKLFQTSQRQVLGPMRQRPHRGPPSLQCRLP